MRHHDPKSPLFELATGETRRVTHGPGNETRATFSPDGKQIAFCSNRSGRFRLYVMGSGDTAVTK